MVDSIALTALLVLFTALPLAWKWQLGVVRVGIVVLFISSICSLAVGWLTADQSSILLLRAAAGWALTMLISIILLLCLFVRDPKRTPPCRNDVVVSPADGQVIYVRECRNGMLPVFEKHQRAYPLVELTKTPLQSLDAVVVGISMSFTDVHVNRAPIDGIVVSSRHFAGKFGSLRRKEMIFENERATTVFQNELFQVAVVQIASRMIRRILVYVREGETVSMGQRMGMIRFGSQVDVVLQASREVRIRVREGEKVRAGETVLAVFEVNSHEQDSR